MGVLPLHLGSGTPVLKTSSTIRRSPFWTLHSRSSCASQRLCRAKALGGRSLHITSSLPQRAAHKPLPHKSTSERSSRTPTSSNIQQVELKASEKRTPKPEPFPLNRTKAWNSFITNVLSGRGDTEAGRKAAVEVVRTGKLPEKYKGASRRYEPTLILKIGL